MGSFENSLKMALAALVLLLAAQSWPEEGMWTYDNFPTAEVKRRYGFEPTAAWLEHVRLASAKLAQGCSGSFVSSAGLVLTNHHCVSRCLEQLSNEKEDRLSNGFYAQQENDELRCPAMEVDQLLQISDVTDRMNRATRGLSGGRFHEAQRAEMAKIEKECATSEQLRCDVITLYRGGRYHLYKHQRFQDVRIVFAPELEAAHFGGEIVGVIFDGNIASLGGDYGYDGRVNRAVSVHSAAIFEALDRLYGTSRLTSELRPHASASGP